MGSTSQVLAGALGGLVVGAAMATTTAVFLGGREPPVAAARENADIVAAIDRLCGALESAPRGPETAPALERSDSSVEPVRSPVSVPSDLSERIRTEVARQLASVPSATPSSVLRTSIDTPATDTAPQTNWDALESLWEREYEHGDAHRTVELLTPAQVLQRFGHPTRLSVSQAGRSQWSYSSEQGQRTLSLVFVDGFASRVSVH